LTISIDEMSIKSHLYYNINKDEVIDLVDNGQCKSFKPARQTCVFLARCIFGTWKQSLLYVFSASMTNFKRIID